MPTDFRVTNLLFQGTFCMVFAGLTLFLTSEYPTHHTCLLVNKSYDVYVPPKCELLSDVQYYNTTYWFTIVGKVSEPRQSCQGINNKNICRCCRDVGKSSQFCILYHATSYDGCTPIIVNNLRQYESMYVNGTFDCWENRGMLSPNPKIKSEFEYWLEVFFYLGLCLNGVAAISYRV